eukprot:m.31114 g.31114  ORF g.31114 m.31114 type:complete len:284 (+) comp16398_c1_seq1:309-1160(+)
MVGTESSIALATILFFAWLGWWRKWLTLAAATSAVPIAMMIMLANVRYGMMLLLFFLSGSLATKYNARVLSSRRKKTEQKDDAASSHSDAKTGRTVMQVVATAGVPAVLCLMEMTETIPSTSVFPAVLGYFACGAGDTLASEFGELSYEIPVLITTLKAAVRGRDGAVSVQGIIASMAGGLLIGCCGGSIRAVVVGVIIGWIGSFLDSFLGAVMQAPNSGLESGMNERYWKISNSLVNLASSVMASTISIWVWNTPQSEYLLGGALALFSLLIASQINSETQR